MAKLQTMGPLPRGFDFGDFKTSLGTLDFIPGAGGVFFKSLTTLSGAKLGTQVPSLFGKAAGKFSRGTGKGVKFAKKHPKAAVATLGAGTLVAASVGDDSPIDKVIPDVKLPGTGEGGGGFLDFVFSPVLELAPSLTVAPSLGYERGASQDISADTGIAFGQLAGLAIIGGAIYLLSKGK